MKNARTAASHFFPKEDILSLDYCKSGNINDTWILCLRNKKKYILQCLNNNVFKNPAQVMNNIRLVSTYLQRSKNILERPNNLNFFSLHQTMAGNDFFMADNNKFWRLLSYIPDSRIIRAVENGGQARELGKSLGVFHRLLQKMDPSNLSDTIEGFHVTPRYMHAYDKIVSDSIVESRDREVQHCIEFIENHRNITDLLEKRRTMLRTQVIHGDPKVTNFLFHHQSDTVISIIDFDTVRLGPLLYDIGDALRSCCNRSGETPSGKEPITFDENLFSAWLDGYFGEGLFLLTTKDRELIVAATLIITFELGLRFLTDYFAGNRYFTVRFPTHNLQRATVQFQLASSIEKSYQQLGEKVTVIASRYE